MEAILGLLVADGDAKFCRLIAEQDFVDHRVDHTLAEGFGAGVGELGFELLQLGGEVHAKHLGELGILHVLVDDLLALQADARLELRGGDLLFAYAGHGLAWFQVGAFEQAVTDHAKHDYNHRRGYDNYRPGLAAFPLKTGEMLFGERFCFGGFGCHRFPSREKTGHGFAPMPRPSRDLLAVIVQKAAREGQQGDKAGLLDGAGQHALVTGAGAGLAARADLALVGDEAPEQVHFFVVNHQLLVSAKLTEFRAGVVTAFASLAVRSSAASVAFFSHDSSPILLERKFVIRRGWFGLFAGRQCGLLRVAAFAALAQEGHLVGDNLHAGMLHALLVVPAAGLQAAFDVDLLSLAEVLLAGFRQVAPGYDVEPFGLGVPLAVAGVPGTADSHREGGDRLARRGVTHFGIPAQVADDHDFV